MPDQPTRTAVSSLSNWARFQTLSRALTSGRARTVAGLSAAVLCLWGAEPLRGQVPEAFLSTMTPRSIGPAGMSGRIAAIEAFAADPNLIFVGSATGGLWKSENGGQTWSSVFDGERVSGIGAIAIHPLDPDLVWVGTGEGNPRNSAGVGAGVYKSTNGGESWELMGLPQSERIHRVVLDPTDPDVVFVGAMGPAWSDGEERGVFRTTDGGVTWSRVLYTNSRSGVSDLVMSPDDPKTLFAGMWEFRREPWFFTSGGPGSGLFVTRDGGDTWLPATAAEGLPPGQLGRIGLSVSPSDPDIVFAVVEADTSALLRSEDRGISWQTVNSGRRINPRPFYYTDIQIDPQDPLRIFNLHSRLEVSNDGGVTFERVGAGVHSDFQAIWIDPEDSRTIYVGTDGGMFVSRDRGEHWRLIDNLPLGQFYHVSVDMDIPFNVYGGMQDNGSWKGPSDVWEVGGIRNFHWTEVSFGDGFGTIPDPIDPSFGYGMSQGGGLVRFNTRTGERKRIRPWAPDSTQLRFNWDAPLELDPFEAGTLYYGSQFVHKSPDRGDTWQIISRDLTTDDPAKQRQSESGGITRDATGAETHTTVVSIASSPVERDVIWAGTDDGNVQVTRSGGGTWENVGENISGVPDGSWVAHIEPSNFSRGGAFVVFDDHRRGNWEPYIFRTDDYGAHWKRIAEDDDLDGFVHTLEQDPLVESLLYAGTEFGLFVSMNGGDRWFRWRHGLPTVPVHSLVVHPRDGDLVIGTHGRAIWILDDVQPLRELAQFPELAQEPLHLFGTPVAYLHQSAQSGGYHFPADAMFRGQTKPVGAQLSFWVAGEPLDSVLEVTILDEAGTLVRVLETIPATGLNRIVWDLHEMLPAAARVRPLKGPRGNGAEVIPGTYSIRLAYGDVESVGTLEVRPDPRVEVVMEDRRAKYLAARRSLELTAWRGELEQAIEDLRAGVAELHAGSNADVTAAAGLVLEALAEGPDFAAADRFRRSLRSLRSSYDAPTEGERLDLIRFEEELHRITDHVNGLLVTSVRDLQGMAQAAGMDVFDAVPLVAR